MRVFAEIHLSEISELLKLYSFPQAEVELVGMLLGEIYCGMATVSLTEGTSLSGVHNHISLWNVAILI